MRLRVDLASSVAKDLQRGDLNEDAYALSDTRIALADGASESYDSKTWAQLLTRAYVLNQAVSVQWVEDKIREYRESSDFSSLSWSKYAAFERGSFATLLGLELAPDKASAEVLAIGDSLAIHMRNEQVLASFPFEHGDEFDARPQLLSTLPSANKFIGASNFFKTSSRTWSIQPGDHILLVTDAVGHWLLTKDDAFSALAAVKTSDEFEHLVIARRQDKSMRLDDSTVLRIAVDADDGLE
ncbi:protein phosphatase 2C domain-containing protein [Alcaligenes sp. DN25]|uniref:SpoIIE family protein phosphatase n=1 Tax=Alcaligenes TaxID=507 RepID=UPI002030DC58|nr:MULTISPECIES: SpoIIE family protein phosphatase [Alcaligenes]URW82162.1 protein phosphatase 2C domain-containing protein [Alcaligenes sp. DN25]WEA66983.1 SpoIIE family protein phosphatase [Alcaligenes faecalis]